MKHQWILLLTGLGLTLAAQAPLARLDDGTLTALRATQAQRVKQQLDHQVPQLIPTGAHPGHEFRLRTTEVDPFGNTVARFDHWISGVRVDGMEAIGVLSREGSCTRLDYSFNQFIDPPRLLNLQPTLSNDQALSKAAQHLNVAASEPQESWVEVVLEPQIERKFVHVITGAPVSPNDRNARLGDRVLNGLRLVQVVHQYFPKRGQAFITRVDALTGEVFASGPNASGSVPGQAQFNSQNGSNTISIPATYSNNTYFLQRGNIFSVNVADVLNPIYSSSIPFFGDGQEYSSGQPTSTNGQTQAVDIAFGISTTYDFYLTVFGRHGIDGSDGYFIPVSAHHPDTFGSPAKSWWYRNAYGQENYWIDFRDRQNPASPGGPTELSVTAHEWTHGVNRRCSRVGTESGSTPDQQGIMEASCTILSTAARLWDATGRGGGIGTPTPSYWTYDWAYQPQVNGGYPGKPSPVGTEFLFRPSRNLPGGYNNIEPSWVTVSRVNWPSDVHGIGAPLHRFFYFLANGADAISDATLTDDAHRGRTSPFMPLGFQGLGSQNATMLYYQAFTQTFTQSMDLSAAGAALQQAGDQLFGSGSANSRSVGKALAAVNLAPPPMYSFTSGLAHRTPSTALILPTGETAGSYYGTLAAGSTSEYYLVTVPPGFSVTTTTHTSPVPASTPDEQGPWVQILDATGSSVLATSECPIFSEWNPKANTLVGGVNFSWKNTNPSPQTVLVNIFSSVPRTSSYTCQTKFWFDIHEITSDDAQAMQW